MVNAKNQHISPRNGGGIVRPEGTKKNFKFFENKEDAVEYAGIITSIDKSFIISHKHNRQFKEFKQGNIIYNRKHKIPVITCAIEITHPIVNNTQPIVETITSI